jgi:hypothetical protein
MTQCVFWLKIRQWMCKHLWLKIIFVDDLLDCLWLQSVWRMSYPNLSGQMRKIKVLRGYCEWLAGSPSCKTKSTVHITWFLSGEKENNWNFWLRDIMTWVVAKEHHLGNTPVSFVMILNPDFASPGITAIEALQIQCIFDIASLLRSNIRLWESMM